MKTHRDGDRLLQLLIFNEEFLVRVVHQTALITSLPLVHTARRYYRLDGLVSLSDCGSGSGNRALLREVTQTLSSRGSKSRNKVSVGEPAEGSFTRIIPIVTAQCELRAPALCVGVLCGLTLFDLPRSHERVALSSLRKLYHHFANSCHSRSGA